MAMAAGGRSHARGTRMMRLQPQAAAAKAPARWATASGTPEYESYFSAQSLARQPSPIRALQPLLAIDGVISLGGGMPNPETFPLEGASFTVRGGHTMELTAAELNAALQYSPTPGIPMLTDEWLRIQRRVHTPPPAADADLAVAFTTGSQEALARAFAMLCGPEDTLIIENPTYSGSLAYLGPLGCRIAEVETDGEGLVPASLRALLDGWADNNPGRKKPRVLYTIPTGANPSGGTMGIGRRREVYAIAQEHDLIVLEDDPYYYLQFNEKRLPSLLSMDTDARVLRFDSFSKVLSAGIRVGTVTGPSPLIDRLCLHTQAVNLHPSGLSQIAVYKLFEHWGDDGFEAHIASIQAFYRGQRDAFLAAAEKHLTGLAEWTEPSAGMFVWLNLIGVDDSFKLISEKAIEAKVILLPGSAFLSDAGATSTYVRAAYSTSTPAAMDEALARLAQLLTDHHDNNN